MAIYAKKALQALLLLACVFVLAGAACASQAGEAVQTQPAGKDDRISEGAEDAPGMEAVAVYYAKRYQGRKTASGARFDHNKMTAAHPSIPLGTRVQIINEENGRSVEVVVNDRCRERSFEIIDLTRAAAVKLGYYGKKGKARVRIIPLEDRQLALNTAGEKDKDFVGDAED